MEIRTSEYVTVGHPDKVADFISSYILDRYLEKDRDTRYAVEVQVKDNNVTLGGEVTSKVVFSEGAIEEFVREAVAAIGYTHEYAEAWGAENAMDASALKVEMHISEQSPDIAQGVDRSGWGDQGIFWGMAVDNERTDYMPEDHELARMIGRNLYAMAKEKPGFMGLDIKTQVEMVDGTVTKVIVAVPCKEDVTEKVERVVDDAIDFLRLPENYELVVNGTGRFVRHSSMGDCGTTGRKLVVDFYGGNCRIGGGSPWTKDGTKADVALNVYAREIAKKMVMEHQVAEVAYVSISSCIGRKEIRITVYDGRMRVIRSWQEDQPVGTIVTKLGLYMPQYAERCMYGLFSVRV